MADPGLVADAGGSNTRVALADGSGPLPCTLRTYRNDAFTGLAPLLGAFLADMDAGPVPALCAGLAGPVRGGRARLTNRDWSIDAADLARATGARRVFLVNDLQAQGLALDDLPGAGITPLRSGRPAADDARLVLGLGTGCNAAAVHRVAGGLFVPASESGHAGLPDRPDMRTLLDHLRAAHPHLPAEAALSGPGLAAIHAWVTGRTLPPEAILALLAEGDAQARETLRLFAVLLGEVAGNLCLAHMATGGLYLTGGTARAVAPVLDRAVFEAAFTARGPYAGLLRDIPVSLVTDDGAGLRGCARHLRQQTG